MIYSQTVTDDDGQYKDSSKTPLYPSQHCLTHNAALKPCRTSDLNAVNIDKGGLNLSNNIP